MLLLDVILSQLNMFSIWEIVWDWMLQEGEKTNIEMGVYRQALSTVEEQLLKPENPHGALLSV